LDGRSGHTSRSVAGDEDTAARVFAEYAATGVRELVVGPIGDERERAGTLALLASLRKEFVQVA
jgi:hypothetical protein